MAVALAPGVLCCRAVVGEVTRTNGVDHSSGRGQREGGTTGFAEDRFRVEERSSRGSERQTVGRNGGGNGVVMILGYMIDSRF